MALELWSKGLDCLEKVKMSLMYDVAPGTFSVPVRAKYRNTYFFEILKSEFLVNDLVK